MTFPLPTLAAVVSNTGITAPSFADIVTSLQTSIKAIYGQDVYLGNDTQDGQLLAVFAKAMSDANNAAIATFLSFSPQTAQGVGLSSIVKINGVTRLVSSFSSVDVNIGGNIGTTITNGVVGDTNGNSWALPATVTIPLAGTILVTATCTAPGAIQAAVGTVTSINTPTRGWATVSNATAAAAGAPVETDAALRLRQAQSVSLPALSPIESTLAAVQAVVGVTEAVLYENPTGAVDANGLPAHSIAVVVTGGDVNAIAAAILNKKTPGCFTYGTTSVNITDAAGIPHVISFFVPTNVEITVAVTIKAATGYTSATGDSIKAALVDFINNDLNIGDHVDIARLYLPAQLYGGPGSRQYELTQLLISATPAAPSNADVVIAFNAQAVCSTSDITLTVT